MATRHSNIPASYLLLIKEDQILLLRRYNTGYADGQYSLPAGHVDPGETFTQAIIREAHEEIGILLGANDVRVAHVMQRDSREAENNERIDTFFIATKWDGEPVNKEPHKCDDLSWFSLSELPQNTLPYVKQAIEDSLNGITYSEFG